MYVFLCSGIDREAVEDLFGKNFLTFDPNPKSRGECASTTSNNSNTQENKSSLHFPTSKDFKHLDDLINLINSLRFLCVHQWSALGDSFLACSQAGSPNQMQKPMLSTRQNNVHWNEEWLD